ncbi:trimeric intracellular cation channel family protein [Roseisalinus antarcticus]|uniref:Glycine transporter domain-containing protein n=1 Tax=Roseisalinus antarcticus TaxID=254357 RepID=A0A1Y5T9F1_9RHOB|nr:trimeric intracellular cation channel family protein [Roseisalinus antarcticus]SLN58567.1 hypothetical protein ROA7023_02691 [Roseisalinus antarcticus]
MDAATFLDFVGVTLFAATGALVASRKQLDIIGFMFLATLTGTGGGTVRDLVLGVPVFWVGQPLFILTCAGTAVVTYFTAHLLESRYRWVLWLDAIALSAYGVFGAYKGLVVTGSPTLAVVMGMMTATLGGVLRDIVAGEETVLMRRDLYISAAMAASVVLVLGYWAGLGLITSSALGFATGFALRSGALTRDWALPTYRSTPGRTPEDSLAGRPRRD